MSSKITDSFKAQKALGGRSGKILESPKLEEARNVTKDFELLRLFDLNAEYGPCIGMTRMERWQRAEKYGLKPPPEIKIILAGNLGNAAYSDCIWSQYDV